MTKFVWIPLGVVAITIIILSLMLEASQTYGVL